MQHSASLQGSVCLQSPSGNIEHTSSHVLPGHSGSLVSRARLLVPLSQVWLHELHSNHSPISQSYLQQSSPSHGTSWVSSMSGGHSAPPHVGGITVLWRDLCELSPQVSLQGPQSDQSPTMQPVGQHVSSHLSVS